METIGSSFDVFLTDGFKNIPVVKGMLPGTKKKPHKLSNGYMYVHNLGVRLCSHPTQSEGAFSGNIQSIIEDAEEIVSKLGKKHRLKFLPFCRFEDKDYWALYPEDRKMSDAELYNLDGEEYSHENLSNKPYRIGNGNIYVGWTENWNTKDQVFMRECRRIATALSFLSFSMPVTLLEQKREKVIGGDNLFGPRHYGVKVPDASNRWATEAGRRLSYFRAVRNRIRFADVG